MRLFVLLGERNTKPMDSLLAGARRLGPASLGRPQRFEPDDVLITWSPFLGNYRADAFRAVKAVGGRAIIMENGWLSPIGETKFYQTALDGWNGTGRFIADGPERWRRWNVPVRPWRRDGRHVLVVEQKPKGKNGDPRAMPEGWAQSVRLATSRPILRRTRWMKKPLADQMADAWCTVVWTSTVAVKSIVEGIPAFYCGPNLICPELAARGTDVERPMTPDREPVFERLAWCQWTAEEVATGEPFARLLALAHDGRPETITEPDPVPPMYTVAGRLRSIGAGMSRRSVIRRRIADFLQGL